MKFFHCFHLTFLGKCDIICFGSIRLTDADAAQICRSSSVVWSRSTELSLRIRNAQTSEKRYAGVAQLVEQRIRNAQVKGSSPFTSLSPVLRNGGLLFIRTAHPSEEICRAAQLCRVAQQVEPAHSQCAGQGFESLHRLDSRSSERGGTFSCRNIKKCHSTSDRNIRNTAASYFCSGIALSARAIRGQVSYSGFLLSRHRIRDTTAIPRQAPEKSISTSRNSPLLPATNRWWYSSEHAYKNDKSAGSRKSLAECLCRLFCIQDTISAHVIRQNTPSTAYSEK